MRPAGSHRRRWAATAEQARAVARRQGSLMLSAGAGSGKTSVLVERFVAAVLEDAISPARILAVTFTERAAGELRQRVRARLLELGAREQARDAEAAYILTVHGFCMRMLRSHPLAAGLDPGFGVLEPGVAQRLGDRAFQNALAGLLGDHGKTEALDLVAAFGVDRLWLTVRSVYDQLRSQGMIAPTLPAPHSGVDPVSARAELLIRARELAVELDVPAPSRPASVQRALDCLGRCEELASDAPDLEVADEAFLAGLRVAPGNTRALQSAAAEAYRRALDTFAQACADRRGADALGLLDELLQRFGCAYAAGKRARSAVDFDDLELEAARLLADIPGLRASWSERFELIMVDEFQDTNRRQLSIMAALDRGNLLTVGDELQSIYGFRHADVTIFAERRRTLAATGDALALGENFRSSPALLETINAVFAPLFEEYAPLRPPVGAASQARAGSAAAHPAGAEPAVELLLTDADGWEQSAGEAELGLGLPPAPAWRHAEARLLALRVSELVDGGTPAGDVAVLVRATGDLGTYERAIEDRGLPTLAAGGGGYWSHQQVLDLTRYLAVVANPLDERSLLELLASPLVGLSLDAVALLGLCARAERQSIAALIETRCGRGKAGGPPPAAGAALDGLDARDRARLEDLGGWFAAERAQAARLGLAQLIERAVERTDYDLHVLSQRAGERRMANVHKLQRLARDFERTEGRDLRAFVEHVRAQQRAGARDPEAPVEDAEIDAVRLMTMHAAKGLEFPVVCLADLGRLGNTDSGALLVDGGRVGLRLPRLDGGPAVDALDYGALRRERLAAMDAEERRVLYVAMTRAQGRLILSGAASLDRWPEARPGACPLSWLGPALVPGLPRGLPAPESTSVISHERAGFQARLRLVISRPETHRSALAAGVHGRRSSAAEQLSLELDALTRPPAPGVQTRAPGSEVPFALSYSSLADYGRCAYRYYVQRVLGLPDEPAPAGPGPAAPGGLDARERGVLLHALLEELDMMGGPVPDARAIAELARARGLAPRPSDAVEAASLLADFRSSAVHARLAAARDLRREHPFVLALSTPDRPLISGVIDVLAGTAEGEALVIDYKTDHADGLDLAAHVERHYAVQRSIYALAVLRSGAEAVEVVHCFLERVGEPVSRRFEAHDAGALEAELEALVSGALDGHYQVAAEPHRELCQTCPARPRLCSWDESMTLRERPPSAPRPTS